MTKQTVEGNGGLGSETGLSANEMLFDRIFEEGVLGDQTDRARRLFVDYGEHLQGDVVNVLHFAIGKDLVVDVLDELDQHYQTNLELQDPEVRGLVYNSGGRNETADLFERIYSQTLGLGLEPQGSSS
jgi:hypothetical protein